MPLAPGARIICHPDFEKNILVIDGKPEGFCNNYFPGSKIPHFSTPTGQRFTHGKDLYFIEPLPKEHEHKIKRYVALALSRLEERFDFTPAKKKE